MTEDMMIDWLKAVFFMWPVPFRTRRILIVDAFAAHITPAVKDFIKKRNVKYVIIPGGLTHLLQPLDVCLNKPIKDSLRIQYEDWFNQVMREGGGTTKSGVIRAPSKDKLQSWLESAVSTLDPAAITRSFKTCSINLAEDRSEDLYLERINSPDGIKTLADEVSKFYELYDGWEQPYEDFQALVQEMREYEHMIYDIDKVRYTQQQIT